MGISALPAHADAGTTLYVSNAASAGCSDTDPATGSPAVPYCTLQTAVDAARPGQTVQIGAGAYPPLRITRSGTAEQPIVLRGVLASGGRGTVLRANLANNSTALDIDGASYVSVSQLEVLTGTSATAVKVQGSSHIDLDSLQILATSGATALDIDGSEDTSVTRTSTNSGPVVVHNQARDTQLVVDSFYQSISTDAAVVVDGASGTLLRNDTIAASLGGSVSVRGGASGTRIDNSVLSQSRRGPELSVAADSTATTTEQYDILQPITGGTPYQWGANRYTTAAAFAQATAQGAADCAGDCGVELNSNGRLTELSAAIDSEDPSVTDLPDTDVNGTERVADPVVDTKGGSSGPVDRGAIEFKDPIHEELAFVPDSAGPLYSPAGGTLRATLANPWNDQVTPAGYTFDFGDGSPVVSGTDDVAVHAYEAGTWSPRVTMTSTTGATFSGSTLIGVQSPAPLTTSIDLGATSATTPLSATVSVWDTSGWPITGRTVDWGDGSAVQRIGAGGDATHAYPRPGVWTVTETTTDNHGRTARAVGHFVAGSTFVAHAPVRLLDTRTTTGGHHAVVAAGGTVSLKVAGVAGIPTSGVTAVVLNLTSTGSSAPGYLTGYSSAGSRPTASSVNFAAGENRSNLATVSVGPDGTIRIYASARTNVIADLAGYYRTGSQVPGGTLMEPVAPTRVLDTRNGSDVQVVGGQVVKIHVPAYVARNQTALVLNVTVVNPSANGFVTVFGSGAVPNASSINFMAGRTTAGQVVVPVAADGTASIANHAGKIHLVVDVEGYYNANAGAMFVPAGPTRLLDTRTDGGPLKNFQQVTLGSGIPADAKAVLLNITETQAQSSGYVAAGQALSTINFAAGQTSSNLALVDASAGVTLVNHSSGVQAIADLQGWFG